MSRPITDPEEAYRSMFSMSGKKNSQKARKALDRKVDEKKFGLKGGKDDTERKRKKKILRILSQKN